MAENATKLPIKNQSNEPAPSFWHPFASLRRDIDRLFDDFGGNWFAPANREPPAPFARGESNWAFAPAVDVTEGEASFDVTAELPGLDPKNIEVTTVNGTLTIKAEKREEKEEKRKDYYFSERQYGSFRRSFRLPESVEAEKIAANFKNGILTVTLPKKAEAQIPKKKIEIKAA